MGSLRASAMIAASLACLAISPARAVPAIGVYFDAGALLTTVHCAPFVPVPAYILLTDSPVVAVDGLRFGYTLTPHAGGANVVYRLSHTLFGATGRADLDALTGSYDLAWATPRVATQPLVLLTWTLMLAVDTQVEFRLTDFAHSGADDILPEIGEGGAWHPVTVHGLCDVDGSGGLSAMLNYNCPIAVEGSAWGGVKALYR